MNFIATFSLDKDRQHPDRMLQVVWPDLAIFWTLGNFLKPLATINLPKSPNILRQFFVKVFKIYYFCSEIIFRQL